jgi:hypothetical protein
VKTRNERNEEKEEMKKKNGIKKEWKKERE